jgi:hypothetical protein
MKMINPKIRKGSKLILTKEVWLVVSNSQLPLVRTMPHLMMLRKKKKEEENPPSQLQVVTMMATLSSKLAL